MMNRCERGMGDNEKRHRRSLLARLETPGLSRTQQRVLSVALYAVLVLFTGGWAVVIASAAGTGQPLGVARELTSNPLSADAPPPATFLLERLVSAVAEERGWRGRSGAIRVLIPEPGDTMLLADTLGLDSLPDDARLEVQQVDSPGVRSTAGRAPDGPGAWRVMLRVRDQVRRLTDLAVLTPISTDLLEDGRIGRYLIGEWPERSERPGRLQTPEYDAPRGLFEVTQATVDLPISDHLVLGDFLTKGQNDVWPKYVALSPKLLDKLELTFQELEAMGHPVENVGVISGFRTPQYNAHGGNTSGRGSFSRHMYGDAMDFYIDNDGDGGMDDLNGDGRVDKGDARVVAEAADRVETKYPEYVGGIGTYSPNPGAHSGFVHVDTRGYRARW
jgi:hypothetical protein